MYASARSPMDEAKMRSHPNHPSPLESALGRLSAVMEQAKRRDRELAYCLRSREGFVRLHGEHPQDPAHTGILVDLDRRIAGLRGW